MDAVAKRAKRRCDLLRSLVSVMPVDWREHENIQLVAAGARIALRMGIG